jgi:hypothetical protein
VTKIIGEKAKRKLFTLYEEDERLLKAICEYYKISSSQALRLSIQTKFIHLSKEILERVTNGKKD